MNVVVNAHNLDRLAEFGPLLAPLAPLRLKFSLIEPEGLALEAFDDLVPPLRAAARAVRRSLVRLHDRFPELQLAWDGFPLCLLPESLRPLEAGLREDGFFAMSEAFEDRYLPVDDRNRTFVRLCAGCSLRRRCRGMFSTYLARCGEQELEPVAQPVSNAFRLIPSGPEEPLEISACPIRQGRRPPPDAVREVLVRTRAGAARPYLAATRDFSDQTLETTIRSRQLVFLPSQDQVVLDDFASQLVRLEPAGDCSACPRRPECGALWSARPGPAFERARALLADRLRRVSGLVLDIGCGSAPYRQALEAEIEAGRLRYVGLDPSPPDTVPRSGQSWIQSRFEEFGWQADPFDTILALRSLNHLDDPLEALRRMAGLLRGGGHVLLAEDVVFGVVRSGAGSDRAAAERAPFEHRFNLELDEACQLADQVGLAVVQRFDPHQTESTLWILELERP